MTLIIQSMGPPVVILHVQLSTPANTASGSASSSAAWAAGPSTERRFDKALTIPQLKAKLEPLTGIMANQQQLRLLSKDQQPVCVVEGDDTVMLGAFPVDNYMTLQVTDLNPEAKKGAFSDLSQVEKYTMEDDKYDQLRDTVRDFKRRNKLGRFDDARSSESGGSGHGEEVKGTAGGDTTPFAHEASAIQVGQRCEVDVSAAAATTTATPTASSSSFLKRGWVRYKGCPPFKPGYWIGVEYDEPVGKHDGEVDGVRYFTCRPRHGAFVRPNRVTVGDFPELDDVFDDDLEEM